MCSALPKARVAAVPHAAVPATPLPQLRVVADEAARPDPPACAQPLTPEQIREADQRFEGAHPTEIIRWAVETFGDGLTMATAFGPEGMAIIHMLSEISPTTHVFNLDTGYQFPETLAMPQRIEERYGLQVELCAHELSVEEYEAKHGGPLYKTKPDQCCFDRKITVLRKAIAGKSAWITAIRRDQSPDRATAPIVGLDKKFGLIKVNPLANWTKKQVWNLIVEHDVPYNPLHDQGYSSIGCGPCTRAVMFGEDERAGRWSGTAKTECGLHTLD